MSASLNIPTSGTLLTQEELSALLAKTKAELKSEIKAEVLAGIEELFKKYVLTQSPIEEPSKPIPVDPKPEEPKPDIRRNCKKGPKIVSVKKGKSEDQLNVVFDAEDVTEIKATVTNKQGNQVLKQVLSGQNGKVISKGGGVFTPDFNNPILVLNTNVSGEELTIKFEGTLCKGEHEYFFFTEASKPPPSKEENCKPTGKINSVNLV
jgi:hypothetical protein